MSDLPAVGLAFLLGAQHGAGPDHLAAVAALATRGGSRWGALRLAARFAAGHSIVLLLATAALGALEVGGIAPPWLGRVGEIAAGAMLVLLGLAALRQGKGYLHSHLHAHEGGEVHAHPHAHEGRDHGRHVHAHGAAALGGAFALAGLPSHLTNVAPVLVATGAVARAACVGAFAAGIFATMVAFGAAADAARSRRPEPFARAASFAVVGVGAVWVAVRLFE